MSDFMVGVAARDITPEPGAPLWGYTDRADPASGTLDPLQAKALVFRAGSSTAALVSMDLGRVPMPDACSRIRARAKRAGVDYVLLTATHTHHAPVMEAGDAPYLEPIENKIAEAIEEAASRLQPALMALGNAQLDIGHNRRKLLKDGRCFMLWRNEERIPTDPVDHEAGLVKFTALDGTPLAVIVHYACHPVVMGPSNGQYSADYVGEMTRLLKEKLGGECLFLQGACGNINPYLDKTPLDQGAVEAMRAVGKECADTLAPALESLRPFDGPPPSVKFVENPVVVGLRWDLDDDATRETLKAVYGPMFDVYVAGADAATLAVPLSVLMLNDSVAFAGFPGEVFVQYQLELKERSPLRPTYLCGYANDYFAYFPTVRDAAAGGYGGIPASFVGLGAGDKLATETEIEIGRLLGKLQPVCTPQDFVLLENGPVPE